MLSQSFLSRRLVVVILEDLPWRRSGGPLSLPVEDQPEALRGLRLRDLLRHPLPALSPSSSPGPVSPASPLLLLPPQCVSGLGKAGICYVLGSTIIIIIIIIIHHHHHHLGSERPASFVYLLLRHHRLPLSLLRLSLSTPAPTVLSSELVIPQRKLKS